MKFDNQIVLMGMSCSGKTTFAKQLKHHYHYCFDAMFPWHDIETLGLSIDAALRRINSVCRAPMFVLDGWHLADRDCKFIPPGTAVYVIYAPYDRIIDQYRVPVKDREEHRHMFHKWYHEIDYPSLKPRYFLNEGQFVETSQNDYFTFLERSQRTVDSSGTQGIVPCSYSS